MLTSLILDQFINEIEDYLLVGDGVRARVSDKYQQMVIINTDLLKVVETFGITHQKSATFADRQKAC